MMNLVTGPAPSAVIFSSWTTRVDRPSGLSLNHHWINGGFPPPGGVDLQEITRGGSYSRTSE